MIGRLRGTLLEATVSFAVVDCGGVGYEVHVPATTAERLPSPGSPVDLHVHHVVREDDESLYGFATREDRELFRLLIGRVSGIGPKVALGILSGLSAAALRDAIARQDTVLLARCPGIGKKTAARLVVELRDVLADAPLGAASAPAASGVPGAPPVGDAAAEAVRALVALGFKPAEADQAVRRARTEAGDDATTEVLVRSALRRR